MQRLIFIFSLFILAIVGCSSNESHSFLIRPDGGGEDAATEIEVGKTIPAWQEIGRASCRERVLHVV